MSSNSSPMNLRSTTRRQLSHSSRDFVIQQGHIQQTEPIRVETMPHSVLIDTSAIDYSCEKSYESRASEKTSYLLIVCGVLAIFGILVFLSWKMRESIENDL